MPGPPNEHLPGRGIVDLTARSRYMDDLGAYRRNQREILSVEERLSLLENQTPSLLVLWEVVEVGSDYDVLGGGFHIRCNSVSGNITVNLPPVSGLEGQMVSIIKIIGANVVTIVPDGSEFLGIPAGADTLTNQWDNLVLIAINSNSNNGWDLVASNV